MGGGGKTTNDQILPYGTLFSGLTKHITEGIPTQGGLTNAILAIYCYGKLPVVKKGTHSKRLIDFDTYLAKRYRNGSVIQRSRVPDPLMSALIL